MRFSYNKTSLVSLFIFILISLSTVNTQSCSPTNCKAICTPSCTLDEVCALGTMIACGVCPTSKCLSINSFPSANNSNSSSNSTNSGLIGGLVGGFIGGGLLLGGAIYLIIRKRNKTKGLPVAFRHKLRNNNNTEMKQRNIFSTISDTSRQVISGVIPVTFIPPSTSTHTSFYSEASAPVSQRNSHMNPFHDRPVSNADSFLTTTTNAEGRRDSIDSITSQKPTRAVVHATQVLRAKPQIMRVNTVRVQDGITRNGSIKKTIQRHDNNKHLDTTPTENPFDDKHIARQSIQTSPTDTRKVTDSVMSTAADGEITIFFNGN